MRKYVTVIIQPGNTQESRRVCCTISVIKGGWVYRMFGISVCLYEDLIFFFPAVFGSLFSLSLHELTLSLIAAKNSPKSRFEMVISII